MKTGKIGNYVLFGTEMRHLNQGMMGTGVHSLLLISLATSFKKCVSGPGNDVLIKGGGRYHWFSVAPEAAEKTHCVLPAQSRADCTAVWVKLHNVGRSEVWGYRAGIPYDGV